MNLKPNETTDAEHFLRVHSKILPPSFPAEVEARERETDKILALSSMEAVNAEDPRMPDEVRQSVHMILWGLAHQLRTLWDQRDSYQRDWYIHEFRRSYYLRTEPSRSGEMPLRPPAESGLHEILAYFNRNVDRAKRCENPECAAPYFFTGNRNTRYCGMKCATWAKREAKRRWDRANKGNPRRRTQ
ncbi:MAG TPA: hypothetical protein VMI10_01945 [Terriglobales bacterium]|nr:hypothetical protein [Terriglobales bacterium]